jgi:hypothetical protein
VAAQAIVYALGTTRVATVSVDSIGLFNSAMDLIRADVRRLDPGVGQVLVSSTHDESAPDPIGLWGPDTQKTLFAQPSPTGTSATSGYDGFYLAWLARRVAAAVARADASRQRATLRLATGTLPANVQSCFSSDPYIDDQLVPVEQGVSVATGKVIFTLVNANTHVETLAFSKSWRYQTTYTGDWPGYLRADLEARWPGSVAMELTGLVGSVETPTVYEPETSRVTNVPASTEHDTTNPDGCHTVYANPSSGTAVADAQQLVQAYGRSMADDAVATLSHATAVTPTSLLAQHQSVCVQLANNLFAAAFAAGLFGPRPGYVDPSCSVGFSPSLSPAPVNGLPAADTQGPPPLYVKTDVAVLTVGDAQFLYLPGEVFPVSAIRGPFVPASEPFPTSCYDPVSHDFGCGPTMAMTPWLSAAMTAPVKFFAGLGEDMIGYLMPPGNFVGSFPQATSPPWLAYEAQNATTGDTDRFGAHHSDDTESAGADAALDVERVVQAMLAHDGPGTAVEPGLFVDAAGHLSDSPFAAGPFAGAVGVVVVGAGGRHTLLVGRDATGWATFDGGADPGTGGTSLRYSVSTAGVMLASGRPLLIDVYRGSSLG